MAMLSRKVFMKAFFLFTEVSTDTGGLLFLPSEMELQDNENRRIANDTTEFEQAAKFFFDDMQDWQ
jgi:hypothetical protein